VLVPELSYTYNYKQACTVFHEFIMGKNMKFLRCKAKLWESGGEAPAAIGGLGAEPPVSGDFYIF